MSRVDENTIGVIPILGTTFTGEFEPIKEIHDRVVAYNAANGTRRPGPRRRGERRLRGAVPPPRPRVGLPAPAGEVDQRLRPQVRADLSGHRLRVWRSQDDLPDDLVFHVNYLGGDMPTFTLNFSRPGNQIIGQYYNFVRLGREGYTGSCETLRDIAVHLSRQIAEMDALRGHQRRHRPSRCSRSRMVDPIAVHRVPRVRPAAAQRLAGAGVHDARRRHRRRRAAHRRAGGLQHGPRRHRCSTSSARPSPT